mmetsp:Transcript_29671/g.71425  ORF Transcript_29671/g.71425 Transcript_29671/m.71425 type:complete len:241 (+) Transcript_29671:190-912(+)
MSSVALLFPSLLASCGSMRFSVLLSPSDSSAFPSLDVVSFAESSLVVVLLLSALLGSCGSTVRLFVLLLLPLTDSSFSATLPTLSLSFVGLALVASVGTTMTSFAFDDDVSGLLLLLSGFGSVGLSSVVDLLPLLFSVAGSPSIVAVSWSSLSKLKEAAIRLVRSLLLNDDSSSCLASPPLVLFLATIIAPAPLLLLPFSNKSAGPLSFPCACSACRFSALPSTTATFNASFVFVPPSSF